MTLFSYSIILTLLAKSHMVVPGAYCMVTKLPDRFLFLNFLSLKFFFKFGEKIEFGMRGHRAARHRQTQTQLSSCTKPGRTYSKSRPEASGPMSSRARAV